MAANDVWLFPGEANPNDVRLRGVPAATSYTLSADGGTYSLSGSAASFLSNRVLVASGSTYATSGTATTLAYNRIVTATGGTYTLSGTAASLTYQRLIEADGGSYALSGTDAGLTLGRELTAEPGTYSLSGSAATFSYTPTPPAPATADEPKGGRRIYDDERTRYEPLTQRERDALFPPRPSVTPPPARVTASTPVATPPTPVAEPEDMSVFAMLVAAMDEDF